MWIEFAEAFIVAIALLYIPGYLFWRAFKFEPIMALCAAPLSSVGIVGLVSIVFEKIAIAANAATVASCTLGICVAVYVILLIGKTNRLELRLPATFSASQDSENGPENKTSRNDWLALTAYVAFGVIVTCFVFISSIGAPDAFFSRWDNQMHISLVRSFLDSNTWSSLVTSQYLAAPIQAQPYVYGPDSYPAGWHDIVAFSCSATNASVTCGMNAVNAAFASVVLPVSIYAFVRAAFPGDRFTLIAGAATASACAVFPWWFFVAGPLYPNFAGLALVPSCAGCAIGILRAHMATRRFPTVIVFGFCSVMSLALLQPNALFFLLIVLASYGASHIFHLVHGSRGRTAAFVAVIGFLVLIAAFWIACLHVPFLQSVVQYQQSAKHDVPATFVNLFGMVGIEPLFAFAALSGMILCIKRRSFWVLAPALFMGVAYIFSRLDPSGIGRALGGFWYTDLRRLGACFGLSLIPLAACGLGALAEFAFARVNNGKRQHAAIIASCAVILVFFALNTFPTVEIKFGGKTYETGFGTFSSQIYNAYNPGIEHNYSAEEVEFVNQVKQVVGDDALIINQPNDGSTFAYGVNGLNTYYRHCRAGDQTEQSVVIRTQLADYASNPAVQSAVNDTGAAYVLQLDQGVAIGDGVWLPQYSNPKPWAGIDNIRDDTPGFKVVLSQGDMRLFAIEDAA